MEHLRADTMSAWRDLDVLVAAEFDALEAARPRHAPRSDGLMAEEQAAASDDLAAEPDDEEAFIERTAAWLYGRADADALLDAVRSALAEPTPSPTERPAQAAPSAKANPGEPPEAPPAEAAV